MRLFYPIHYLTLSPMRQSHSASNMATLPSNYTAVVREPITPTPVCIHLKQASWAGSEWEFDRPRLYDLDDPRYTRTVFYRPSRAEGQPPLLASNEFFPSPVQRYFSNPASVFGYGDPEQWSLHGLLVETEERKEKIRRDLELPVSVANLTEDAVTVALVFERTAKDPPRCITKTIFRTFSGVRVLE